MGGIIDKPGIRESIDLLQALARCNPESLTEELIKSHLCYIGKRRTDLINIRKGIARIGLAIRTPHPVIDEWVEWAINESTSILEENLSDTNLLSEENNYEAIQ